MILVLRWIQCEKKLRLHSCEETISRLSCINLSEMVKEILMRWYYHAFVGISYVFVYSQRHKVVLK